MYFLVPIDLDETLKMACILAAISNSTSCIIIHWIDKFFKNFIEEDKKIKSTISHLKKPTGIC